MKRKKKMRKECDIDKCSSQQISKITGLPSPALADLEKGGELAPEESRPGLIVGITFGVLFSFAIIGTLIYVKIGAESKGITQQPLEDESNNHPVSNQAKA